MRLRIGITVALGCLAAGPTVCAHENVIILGDSITAGVSYLSLSDDSARESWANRVLAALGEPPDLPRLESPAPADFARLARDGWGFDAWRFVASALPWVLDRDSRFVAGEPRSIVAVPGETVHEALTQSSHDPGVGSTASILGPLLLPEGLTAIETAEASARDLDWAILWLGANDLLSAFRLVGTASPPTPDQFARDYEELARRLGALLAPGTPPSHLLLGTLPDVTEVPIWRPLPPGARDEHGEPFETGSVASAFLVHFRDDRFERGREAFAPADVAAVRELVREYDVRIRAIADRLGATVVDFGALLKELAREPEWDAIDSPWFSPDLLHPSPRTHAAIAARVLDVMGEVGSPALAGTTPPVPVRPDPTAAEASRRFALMRTAMLGTGAYSFPPRPAVRLSVDVGGRLDDGRD
ncbi:MAG: SGNH/GDSL hydrolase family protein, partial [Gemmatimonadetes bacterium]|nr:SGNH/GDSL hydrolase family protein [Gemmatimonadota bacterium]